MKVEFHDLDLIRSKEEPDATNVEIAPIRPRRMDACADMETAVKGMVAGAYNSANARTKPRRDSSYRYVAGSPGYQPRRFLNKAAYASAEVVAPYALSSTPGSISPSDDPAHNPRPSSVHGAGSREKADDRAAHVSQSTPHGSAGGGGGTRGGSRGGTRGSSRSGREAAARGADWKCVFLTGYTGNTAARLMSASPARSNNTGTNNSANPRYEGGSNARDERLAQYGLPPGWPRPRGAWIDGPQYGGRFSQPFLSTQSFAVGPPPPRDDGRAPARRSALRPGRGRGRRGPPPCVAAAEFELNRYQLAHLQKYAFTCPVRPSTSASPLSLRSALESSLQSSYLNRCVPSTPQTYNNTHFVRQAFTLPKHRIPGGSCSPMHHFPPPPDTAPSRPRASRGYAQSAVSKTLSYNSPAPVARENSARTTKAPAAEEKLFSTASKERNAGAGDMIPSIAGKDMEIVPPNAIATYSSSPPNNSNQSEHTASKTASDAGTVADGTLGTGSSAAVGTNIVSGVNPAIWVADASTTDQQ